MTDRRYVKTGEAGRIVDYHPQTLRRLIREGSGPPFIWVNGRRKFRVDRLLEWLEARPRTARQREG